MEELHITDATNTRTSQCRLDYQDNDTTHVLHPNASLYLPASSMVTEVEHFRYGVDILNMYGTPVIILIGFVANTLSFLVFSMPRLRQQSSSVYLKALALSDNGFLVSLSIGWFSSLNMDLIHKEGFCQLFVLITYVCSFLSVWNIASFTIERYIAVIYPLHRNWLCTVYRARIIVSAEFAFALLLYSFSLWTSKILEVFRGYTVCAIRLQFIWFVEIMTYIDTVITLIIPSVVIFVLNGRIAMTVYRRDRHRYRLSSSSRSLEMNYIAGLNPAAAARRRNTDTGEILRTWHASTTQPSSTHVTKMLLVVSMVFLALHLPRHTLRFYHFIMDWKETNYILSNTALSLQKLFWFMSYLNYGINFFLYTGLRQQFRSEIKQLFHLCCGRLRPLWLFCSGQPSQQAAEEVYLGTERGTITLTVR